MSHDPAHVALELSGAEAWELAEFVVPEALFVGSRLSEAAPRQKEV